MEFFGQSLDNGLGSEASKDLRFLTVVYHVIRHVNFAYVSET